MQAPPYEPFGKLLRHFRKRAGLTQDALAKAMVIDFSYLSKIEKGTVKPPVAEKLKLAAEELELSPEERDELFTTAANITDDFESWVLRSPGAQELYRSIRNVPENDQIDLFRELIRQVRERRTHAGGEE